MSELEKSDHTLVKTNFRKFALKLKSTTSISHSRFYISHIIRRDTLWQTNQNPERRHIYFQNLQNSVEPIDYESFMSKNAHLIESFPFKEELLLFPPDDVQVIQLERSRRTYNSTVPVSAFECNDSLLRQCIKSYECKWSVVVFKNQQKSSYFCGSFCHLPTPCRKASKLNSHEFEIDLENTSKILPIPTFIQLGTILKEGWLLKGQEISEFPNIKTFRKRYAVLCSKSDDKTVIEMYKDAKKHDLKETIYLEECTSVVKNTGVKGSLQLDFKNSPSVLFSFENKEDLHSWFTSMYRIAFTVTNHSSLLKQGLRRSTSLISEQSARTKSIETFALPQNQRQSNTSYCPERINLFDACPLPSNPLQTCVEECMECEPLRKSFGVQFSFSCLSLKSGLSLVYTNNGRKELINPEPFFVSFALFDVQQKRKISENFHWNPNYKFHEYFQSHEEPSSVPLESANDEKNSRIKNAYRNSVCDHVDVKQCNDDLPAEAFAAIFSVSKPSPYVYLIARIEKLLTGSINEVTDIYNTGNSKFAHKCFDKCYFVANTVGSYTMPFAWGYKPVFQSNHKNSLKMDSITPFRCFRQETNKLSDEEMVKILCEHLNDEGKHSHKLVALPKLVIEYKTELFTANDKYCYTSSLQPVRPQDVVVEDTCHHYEVEEFFNEQENLSVSCSTCFMEYTHNLYIYPRCLKYDSQKSFGRARNISVCVEIKNSDLENAGCEAVIYDKIFNLRFTSCAFTAVSHHCSVPQFYEEIKVKLPPVIGDKYHILFTFYHISCNVWKSNVGKSPENIVGFCWYPIMKSKRLNNLEATLRVSPKLFSEYLNTSCVAGDKETNAQVKWVDGGKGLFSFKMSLVSTIFTEDPHLYNFFSACNHLKDSTSDHLSNSLKALHAVKPTTFIQFLVPLMNQLFEIILCAISSDVSVQTVRTLLHVAAEVSNAGKVDLLKSYIVYVSNVEDECDLQQAKPASKVLLHEEIVKYLCNLLQPICGSFSEKCPVIDVVVIKRFLLHSWFFFEAILKNFVLSSYSKNGSCQKASVRSESSVFYADLLKFINIIMAYFSSVNQELLGEVKIANNFLANFLKKSLNVMNRGKIFELISACIGYYQQKQSQILYEMKCEFIYIICCHEYFVQLSMPASIFNDALSTFKGLDTELVLSDTYRTHHFLSGMLISEIANAMHSNLSSSSRIQILYTLCDVLCKQSYDSRYSSPEVQSHIANLYFPFINMLVDLSEKIYHSISDVPEPYASQCDQNDNSNQANQGVSIPSQENSGIDSMPGLKRALLHISGPSLLPSNRISEGPNKSMNDGNEDNLCCTKFSAEEVKMLLLSGMAILKAASDDIKIKLWKTYSADDIFLFFNILMSAIKFFRYRGKQSTRILNEISSVETTKFLSQPSNCMAHNNNFASCCELTRKRAKTSNAEPEDQTGLQAVLDGNISCEIALTVVDILELFSENFEYYFQEHSNPVSYCILGVYISLLQENQSKDSLLVILNSLLGFLPKISWLLFESNTPFCGNLCYEILSIFSSSSSEVRTISVLVFLRLLEFNFEYSNRSKITRLHFQTIKSVSRLISQRIFRSYEAFQLSLNHLDEISVTKGIFDGTSFSKEVSDLTRRIRNVLFDTARMQKKDIDSDTLLELHYNLALSYSSTPELRKTWLENLAEKHVLYGNFAEAGYCYIHIAALLAEFLRHQGDCPAGCSPFDAISPNIAMDESFSIEDYECHQSNYSEDDVLKYLQLSVDMLFKDERYEILPLVYSISVPIFERRRNYEELYNVYDTLKNGYEKILQRGSKRLFGQYYRIRFFGEALFENESGKDYIYKEPKITSLAELCDKLQRLYQAKFGASKLRMITDSNKVDLRALDPNIAYIQITFVKPYFDEQALNVRCTAFERANNIKQFFFDQPVTVDGRFGHGTPETQCKLRTVLTTSHCFPYIKRRISVVCQQEETLSPIETAIDEMKNMNDELLQVINEIPVNYKLLQLRLSGSISPQVHSGSLAYAEAFLLHDDECKYPREFRISLIQQFRKFLTLCTSGLSLHASLCTQQQYPYHQNLEKAKKELEERLKPILDVDLLEEDRQITKTTNAAQNFLRFYCEDSSV